MQKILTMNLWTLFSGLKDAEGAAKESREAENSGLTLSLTGFEVR